MDKKRKDKLSRFGFILGGFLLLLNGVVSIGQTKLIFGLVQIFGSILNFGMLSNFKSIRSKQILEAFIFVMNSVISLLIAINYFKAGSTYIQYMWMFSSIMFLLALIYKKRKINTA